MLGADAFLIAEERLTLIDAGMVGSRIMLERYLRRIGRRLDELERIICTHGHPDHIGGVSELVRDRDDVTVLIHPDDLAGLRLPLREALARTDDRAVRRGRLIQYLTRAPADPTPIEDGEVLPILGGLRVVHTPGHTPGSICLYAPSQRASSSPATCFRCSAAASRMPARSSATTTPARGPRSSGWRRSTSTPSPSPTTRRGATTATERSPAWPRRRRASGTGTRGTGREAGCSGPVRSRRARGTRPLERQQQPSVVAVTVAVRGDGAGCRSHRRRHRARGCAAPWRPAALRHLGDACVPSA